MCISTQSAVFGQRLVHVPLFAVMTRVSAPLSCGDGRVSLCAGHCCREVSCADNLRPGLKVTPSEKMLLPGLCSHTRWLKLEGWRLLFHTRPRGQLPEVSGDAGEAPTSLGPWVDTGPSFLPLARDVFGVKVPLCWETHAGTGAVSAPCARWSVAFVLLGVLVLPARVAGREAVWVSSSCLSGS